MPFRGRMGPLATRVRRIRALGQAFAAGAWGLSRRARDQLSASDRRPGTIVRRKPLFRRMPLFRLEHPGDAPPSAANPFAGRASRRYTDAS